MSSASHTSLHQGTFATSTGRESQNARFDPASLPVAPDVRTSALVLIATGSFGDFLPVLEIGARLVERGHAVVALCYRNRKELVEQRGMIWVEYPMSLIHKTAPPPNLPLWMAGSRYFQDFLHLFRKQRVAFHQTQYLYGLLRALIDRGWSHVVGPEWCLGFREFAETHPGRAIHILLTPASIHSAYGGSGIPNPPFEGLARRLYRKAYWIASDLVYLLTIGMGQNRSRMSFGLRPRFRLRSGWEQTYGTSMGLFSDWYGPRLPDWPAIYCAGFIIPEVDSSEEVPQDLRDFLDRSPTVLFTCGSQCHRVPRFFKVAMEYAELTGRQVLLLGANTPPMGLDETRVRWYSFLPIRLVLPLCSAIVHHGGVGTTVQSILAATPQVVVPIVLDQWAQAQRVEELRLGMALKPSQFDAKSVDAALASLDESDGFRKRAEMIAEIESASTAVDDAVQFLESAIAGVDTECAVRQTADSTRG